MAKTMKRLMKTGPMTTTLVDVPMPTLPNEKCVLVKLKYCGVCMSEHYDWSADIPARSFGHEPIGVVVEVGSEVTTLKVGDRVSGGGFGGGAEYAVAHAVDLVKIPDHVSDTAAVIEPLACLLSAVGKLRGLMNGEKVAVVGCGYMGCGAISLLAMKGYDVVAVDKRPECLENAKKYGASETYLPEEIPENYFSDKNPKVNGFPIVMEWGETNESLDLAIRMTRMCGQLAVAAYHTGEKRNVNFERLGAWAIDLLNTHPREDDINRRANQLAMKLLETGKWNYLSVPTKVYPIKQFDKAQGELTVKYGKWMKAVVDWSDVNADFEPYIVE